MLEILPPERPGFYVDFQLREEEDREESIKRGMPIPKNVEYAIITMPGGGLVVDKAITDKVLHEWLHGDGRRKPPAPFAYHAYQAWKLGLEAPVNGADLKNWPGVTPAQLKMCQYATVRTVEDLAAANADTVRKLGMGGIALVQKAKAYLSAADTNKAAEQISALCVKMEALQAALDKKDRQIEALMEQLEGDADEKPKRTRRKRNADGELE